MAGRVAWRCLLAPPLASQAVDVHWDSDSDVLGKSFLKRKRLSENVFRFRFSDSNDQD